MTPDQLNDALDAMAAAAGDDANLLPGLITVESRAGEAADRRLELSVEGRRSQRLLCCLAGVRFQTAILDTF